MLCWAHLSPQPKRHLDWFSHFTHLTAESRRACLGMSFVLKLSHGMGRSGPHPLHGSGSTQVHTQTASRSVRPVLHSSRQCRRACPGKCFPLKIAPLFWAIWTHVYNVCFLGPTRVHNPNGDSIGSAIFAQFTAECRRACPQNVPYGMSLVYTLKIVPIRLGRSGPKWVPWAYPSPQPKLLLDRFSHFCTGKCRLTTRRPFSPLKIAPSYGWIRTAM